MSSTLAVGQGSSTQGALAGGQGSSTSGQMGSASMSSAASHVGTSSMPSAGGQSTSQHLQGTPTSDYFLYKYFLNKFLLVSGRLYKHGVTYNKMLSTQVNNKIKTTITTTTAIFYYCILFVVVVIVITVNVQ